MQSAAESRLWRRARQYLDDGQLVAAQATLEALVQRVPDAAPARMELAQVMLQRGQLRAAASQLLQAAERLPGDPATLVQLARHLCEVGEVQAARRCLDQLASLPDLPATLLAELAHMRSTLGEIPAASKALQQALAAGLDTPDEYYLHAMLLQFSGDLPAAEEVLRECLQRWPFFSGAVMALANLHKQTPTTQHLDRWQGQLQRIPVDGATAADKLVRAEFESAIFKELDDLGRHDEAWVALASSNALMHELNPYDRAIEQAVTDALIESAAAAAPTRSGEFAGPTPIFIIGMPRSGTTLLDRMLSNHSQVTSAGEINDFMRQFHWAADVPPGGMLQAIRRSAQIDYAELGARYLQQTQWRAQGRAYYIDKLPANVQMVSFIRHALPHAPILHMLREPMDVCFSNFRAMFGNNSAYSYELDALAHYYGQYERLARRWRELFANDVLEVPYTDLVSSPEATLRRVLQHCHLDLEAACLHPEGNVAPVATPSSVQVREAIHTRSLGQWRRYARQLEPLRLLLEGQALPK